MVVTKRSRKLKQTCSWKLQVCFGKTFLLPPGIEGLIRSLGLKIFQTNKLLWKIKKKKNLNNYIQVFLLRELHQMNQMWHPEKLFVKIKYKIQRESLQWNNFHLLTFILQSYWKQDYTKDFLFFPVFETVALLNRRSTSR